MQPDLFVRAAENLTIDSVEVLASFYAEDCRFTDPFQTVHSRTAVAKVYRSMFTHLVTPRFTHVRVLGQPATGVSEILLGWDFEFALGKDRPRQSIPGCSLLRLNTQGEIQEHVDYWDASLLMQGLPIIGRVIRWVRQKIGSAH